MENILLWVGFDLLFVLCSVFSFTTEIYNATDQISTTNLQTEYYTEDGQHAQQLQQNLWRQDLWLLPDLSSTTFYRFFPDHATWDEADAICQKHRGELVTADGDSSRESLRTFIHQANVVEPVWVGRRQLEPGGQFVWSGSDNDESLSDDYWLEEVPLSNMPLCVVLDPAADFRWRPWTCDVPGKAAFICQMDVPSWLFRPEDCTCDLDSLIDLQGPARFLSGVYHPDNSTMELQYACTGTNKPKKMLCVQTDRQQSEWSESIPFDCSEHDVSTGGGVGRIVHGTGMMSKYDQEQLPVLVTSRHLDSPSSEELEDDEYVAAVSPVEDLQTALYSTSGLFTTQGHDKYGSNRNKRTARTESTMSDTFTDTPDDIITGGSPSSTTDSVLKLLHRPNQSIEITTMNIPSRSDNSTEVRRRQKRTETTAAPQEEKLVSGKVSGPISPTQSTQETSIKLNDPESATVSLLHSTVSSIPITFATPSSGERKEIDEDWRIDESNNTSNMAAQGSTTQSQQIAQTRNKKELENNTDINNQTTLQTLKGTIMKGIFNSKMLNSSLHEHLYGNNQTVDDNVTIQSTTERKIQKTLLTPLNQFVDGNSMAMNNDNESETMVIDNKTTLSVKVARNADHGIVVTATENFTFPASSGNIGETPVNNTNETVDNATMNDLITPAKVISKGIPPEQDLLNGNGKYLFDGKDVMDSGKPEVKKQADEVTTEELMVDITTQDSNISTTDDIQLQNGIEDVIDNDIIVETNTSVNVSTTTELITSSLTLNNSSDTMVTTESPTMSHLPSDYQDENPNLPNYVPFSRQTHSRRESTSPARTNYSFYSYIMNRLLG